MKRYYLFPIQVLSESTFITNYFKARKREFSPSKGHKNSIFNINEIKLQLSNFRENKSNGVRQHDPFSTAIFNITIENILQDHKYVDVARLTNKAPVSNSTNNNLVLITRTRNEITRVINKLEETAGGNGLKINEKKTEYFMLKLTNISYKRRK